MAANLNPPSDFLRKPPVPPSNQLVLLPPSSFESSRQTDPWIALAHATGEIIDLKEQNTKLQESKNITFPTGEEIKAHVDVHQHQVNPVPSTTYSMPDQVELRHYHDIISHQAAEIVQFKEQLLQTTNKYEKQLAQLEGQLLLKESQHAQQLSSLEERLRLISEQYDIEKEKLQSAKDKCERDHMSAASQWSKQLESTKKQYTEEIDHLKKTLQESQQKSVARETELTNKIREYDLLLEEQAKTISQLKTYLSENSLQSSEIWKREIEGIRQKLEDKELERSKMASQMESLNIRLKSLNDLMLLQEKELSKVKECTTEKRKHCLLTRWREKVFELLVQLKCTELSHEDERRHWSNQLHDTEEMLETCKIQIERLECLVQDKQAQLDMEANNVKMLERELMRAQQVALELDEKLRRNEAAFVEVVDNIKSTHTTLSDADAKYRQSMSTLTSYSQRLAFASGRIELLQGQFARKEALIRIALEEGQQERPTKDTPADTEVIDNTSENQLRAELARVTEERDAFAAQIKSDAKLLESKVLMAKQQVAEEVNLLKVRLEELHLKLETKNKEADDLRQEVTDLRQQLDESQESIDLLKIQLAQLDAKAEQDKEYACSQLQSRFTEHLAGMEQKLNEARREQTKSVVALRQMEREVTREKKRLTEQMETLEQYYKQELTKLEQRLLSADKDRNLLMATLRQEGLIGKYKLQRLSPLPLPGDDFNKDDNPTKTILSRPHADSADDEPLHAVIDDVKNLAKAVLEDSEEDSGEDTRTKQQHDSDRLSSDPCIT